ncbi:unnamed protein product, partial [Iphiclides podalirius]
MRRYPPSGGGLHSRRSICTVGSKHGRSHGELSTGAPRRVHSAQPRTRNAGRDRSERRSRRGKAEESFPAHCGAAGGVSAVNATYRTSAPRNASRSLPPAAIGSPHGRACEPPPHNDCSACTALASRTISISLGVLCHIAGGDRSF